MILWSETHYPYITLNWCSVKRTDVKTRKISKHVAMHVGTNRINICISKLWNENSIDDLHVKKCETQKNVVDDDILRIWRTWYSNVKSGTSSVVIVSFVHLIDEMDIKTTVNYAITNCIWQQNIVFAKGRALNRTHYLSGWIAWMS